MARRNDIIQRTKRQESAKARREAFRALPLSEQIERRSKKRFHMTPEEVVPSQTNET